MKRVDNKFDTVQSHCWKMWTILIFGILEPKIGEVMVTNDTKLDVRYTATQLSLLC